MKRRPITNIWIVVAIVVVMAAARWGWGAYRQYQQTKPRPQSTNIACATGQAKYGGAPVEVIGDANAPLRALWVVPGHAIMEEGVQAVEEVKEWVGEHPKLVRLTVAILNTAQANQVMQAEGVRCAGLSVKGQTRFRLWDKNARRFREVVFEKAPGPPAFRAPQVIDFFEQYLENAGHLPRNRTLGQPAAPPQRR